MDFFKDSKYKVVRIFLILVVVVGAGWFTMSNMNLSNSNQGSVINQNSIIEGGYTCYDPINKNTGHFKTLASCQGSTCYQKGYECVPEGGQTNKSTNKNPTTAPNITTSTHYDAKLGKNIKVSQSIIPSGVNPDLPGGGTLTCTASCTGNGCMVSGCDPFDNLCTGCNCAAIGGECGSCTCSKSVTKTTSD